jgi:hypothetical protein
MCHWIAGSLCFEGTALAADDSGAAAEAVNKNETLPVTVY